ncbi:hypothetical protein PSSHI_32130 [Photobacterium sp. R1]
MREVLYESGLSGIFFAYLSLPCLIQGASVHLVVLNIKPTKNAYSDKDATISGLTLIYFAGATC